MIALKLIALTCKMVQMAVVIKSADSEIGGGGGGGAH